MKSNVNDNKNGGLSNQCLVEAYMKVCEGFRKWYGWEVGGNSE